MFYFNDECDLMDEDRYDFFTLTADVERRDSNLPPNKHPDKCICHPVAAHRPRRQPQL
jgi:hypothetical protein